MIAAQQGGSAGTARNGWARATVASLVAIGSLVAASSCRLPIIPFVVAAGLAGGSTFLLGARPYLLAASVPFIALGFFPGFASKEMSATPASDRLGSSLVSAALIFISIFLPQVMANAIAGLMSR